MSRGTVTVDNLNLTQGEFPEIERKLLFIGVGDKPENVGKTLSLSNASDFDALFGDGDSELKSNLTAARLNAGENWFAWALPVNNADDNDALLEGVELAFSTSFKATSPEGLVILRTAQSGEEVSDWYDFLMDHRGRSGRQMFAIVALPGVLATQTWSDYEAAMGALVADVAANRVCVVPQLHGNDTGVLAGRLCNRAVSIADTPMRKATGPLLGLGDTPVDSAGTELPESTLIALDAARLSTLQHYADVPGTYFADGNLLEVPGGDYQVIEHLRPVLKACRAVRILAIENIGNRNFNDTPDSVALYKREFARPLREMSRVTQVVIGGQTHTLVGDIEPPKRDAVAIQWLTRSQVRMVVVVRPYACPKDIKADVVLDLSQTGASS